MLIREYNERGMRKRFSFGRIEPERCWVGDVQKICYASREEAEVAAQIAAHDYQAPKLTVYHCEYGDHWHLSSSGKSRNNL